MNTLAFPLQYTSSVPASLIYWVKGSFVTQHELLRENVQLKQERLLLEVKMQQFTFLEQQNQELRVLLGLTQKIRGKYATAEIVAVNMRDFGQQVIVNKGKSDGIYVGQSAVDIYGVIGQVIAVDALSSRVMLITDSKSAIPVVNVRNGTRAIVMGTNDPGVLDLAYVSETADIKEGDILVTSGVGLQLPAGYAVGVVSSISRKVGERFVKVAVLPYAHVNSSRHVLVVWPDQEARGSAGGSGSSSGKSSGKRNLTSSKKHTTKGNSSKEGGVKKSG